MLTSFFRVKNLFAILLTSVGLCNMADAAESLRAIPDNNLAYPVLISSAGQPLGSGVYLKDGDSLYFATARHVLFATPALTASFQNIELRSYSPNPDDLTPNRISLDLKILAAAGAIKAHPKKDVAIIKIAAVSDRDGIVRMNLAAGATFLEQSANGVTGGDMRSVVKFLDKVLVGNEVIVFGYPTTIGLAQQPQIDADFPLLRKGMVAGRNRKLETIVIDAPLFNGNSGGPVIQIDQLGFERHFSIIGLVSEVVPFDNSRWLGKPGTLLNSNYSIVVPMDFVAELIKQFSSP